MDAKDMQREIDGLTHERNVARKACENLTAMCDALLAKRDRLRDDLAAANTALRRSIESAEAERDRLRELNAELVAALRECVQEVGSDYARARAANHARAALAKAEGVPS